MTPEHNYTLNAESVLDNITRTLLYEGYALYPYHRSAIKNQMPVPFGVVFPQHFNIYNEHAHSNIQTQCIVTGTDSLAVNGAIRFLHLKKLELSKRIPGKDHGEDDFIPVYDLNISGESYRAGWQTIERTLEAGNLQIIELIKNRRVIPFEFDKICDINYVDGKNGEVSAKQISKVSEIKGELTIEAHRLENMENAFRITIGITNTTPVKNAETITRNDVLTQSFLSTHIILKASNAAFISHQNPDEKWTASIAECRNINTWPILIDKDNSTLLSSPIILYDYPEINPQSMGDLFDSTEIEEALLLHVGILSDDEKKQIAQSDEKLRTMLNKVSGITPEELINFHSGLKDSSHDQTH